MSSQDKQIQDLSYENIRYRQHIEKLTKRVEIAEKALGMTIFIIDSIHEEEGIRQTQIDALNEAKHALQQLRE